MLSVLVHTPFPKWKSSGVCLNSHLPSDNQETLDPDALVPRAAARFTPTRLGVAQISNTTASDPANTFVRPIYASGAIAIAQSADPIKVIRVRATGLDPVADKGGGGTSCLECW
ncbi:hypothetical protein [Burkholderia gladioli]|uniref:hypothetical protein n=1 Tax=Burkholderia gladioli TaxID=28095 RepID=UPI003C79A31E